MALAAFALSRGRERAAQVFPRALRVRGLALTRPSVLKLRVAHSRKRERALGKRPRSRRP